MSLLHLTSETGPWGSQVMYSSSALESLGWDSGLRYSNSQNTSQAKPSAPVAMKAARHPQRNVIHGTISGVRIAPAFVPALKIPVPSARSFLGNDSATVFILAGNTPSSPNPRVVSS